MNRPMRRKDRLVSDFDEMVSIASRARQIIIGMVDDGQPYLVPLDFGYKVHDGILSFYCHSASQGRKIDEKKSSYLFCSATLFPHWPGQCTGYVD